MIQTVRFWAAFSIQACGFGNVLIVVNLLKQISEANSIKNPDVYVALLGLASALSRASFGFISQHLESRFTYIGMMGLVNGVVSLVNLVYAFTTNEPVLFAGLVMMTGFCHGAIAVLASAVNVDMFGRKYIATNDGMFDLANSFGSLVFVFVLVTIFPVDDSDKTDQDDGIGCTGTHCFKYVFVASSVLCFVVFVCSLFLNHWLLKMRRMFPGSY